MKLGGMFGKPKTLARSTPTAQPKPGTNKLATVINTKKKPGEFNIKWPKVKPQQVKDYKAILTLADLEAYLLRCQETGKAGFDWETAASEDTREEWEAFAMENEQQTRKLESLLVVGELDEKEHKKEVEELGNEYDSRRKKYLRTPLDPWKGEICTVSVSAAAHESRVVPISHRKGKVFEPDLSRDEARKLVLDTMDRLLFKNDSVIKIAVNLSFETKYAAKYGKYILMPVADPLLMWVRCLQIVAPHKIKNPKKPTSGWGLKPATKHIFGVEMNDFSKLLAKHGIDFFDEIDASQGDGLLYSAEDSDYAIQHYDYWLEIAKQIPMYDKWLHHIEMPFSRVIGLMEYWGMAWDSNQAEVKRQEAETMQEVAADRIKQIAKETFDIDINPGKSGKTGEVKHVIFELMKLPAAKWSSKTGNASLDEEALIDMRFILENHLETIEEEKYLAVDLPEGWEQIDPETDPHLDKDQRGAIRIAQRGPHKYKDQGLALIEQLLKIQKYSTLLSSHIVGREKYLNNVSGRIHAGYSPFTETGRLNSFSPNGQNVPRTDNDEFGIRNFYVPKPGKILFFIDFSGFELRLMAWKSGDEVMIDLFNNGGDMHRRTAHVMTEKPESEITKDERNDAKAGNFGISYGGTEHALQKTFKVKFLVRKTLDECKKIVDAVKTAYSKIPEYQREIVLEAREKGYVQTIYGYIRLLPGINSANRKDRSGSERQAANTPIQGSAADVMKKAQNDVYDAIGKQIGVMKHGATDMIGQVHDEIIFEMDDDPEVVAAAGKYVKDLMEREPLKGFPVPIEAEASAGYTWGNKKDLEDWLKERGA
jgi:DNA polymerase-1